MHKLYSIIIRDNKNKIIEKSMCKRIIVDECMMISHDIVNYLYYIK